MAEPAELKPSEHEARFRELADAMPQIVWAASAEGHIEYYNRLWYQITGLPDSHMRDGPNTWVHPDDLPRCDSAWRRSLANGVQFEVAYRLKTTSGAYRWHLSRAIPVRDEQGKLLRWLGSSTDIDDQKRAEEQLRDETRVLEILNKTGQVLASNLDLESLLQAITDAATEVSGAAFGSFFYNSITADGECLTLFTLSGAPRQAFEKFGRPRHTALFAPTFRGEGAIRSDDILQDPRYGKNAPFHGMPDGHLPVRSYMAVPVTARSGRVIGCLLFGHPEVGKFTQRSEKLVVGIASQAAVAIDNAELYEAVKRTANERDRLLEAERAARREAEEASRLKDEFLANLSHELRTPLAAILGWAHVLQLNPADSDKLKSGLGAIERNARAQRQLIDDLLDMNRIISGKMRVELQITSLMEVVNGAVTCVKLAAEAKRISLRTVLDSRADTVLADPARLQQVFWNLLSNAVKFTPEGGRIELEVARADTHIEVIIRDNGIGIRPDFLPYMFDRFRQADASSTRAHGGLGLGLSIARQLLEMHGGAITAASDGVGLGATFTVKLPIPATHATQSSTAASQPAASPNSTPLAGVRILLVDDETDSREAINAVLTAAGAEAIPAASADAALAQLGGPGPQPDVLISDLAMPNQNGYQLISAIRSGVVPRHRLIPALALSAFAQEEDRALALECGFQHHCAKPVEPDELVAVVLDLVAAADPQRGNG